MTLNVPVARSCRLESILAEHTKLEIIDEFTCRRCSVLATHRRLSASVQSQKGETSASTGSTGTSKSVSKKKRIRELQKTVGRLEEVIEAEDYEREMEGVLASGKLDRAAGPATKQAMYASPPTLLVIHLSRSSFMDSGYGYSSKNNCQVRSRSAPRSA
jgi:ubiquitin carboxyl-terminal hydrolase 1